MNPGAETVTFITKSGSSRDALGNRIVVETRHDVRGCAFQPRRMEDQVSDTEFAASTHQCYCPVTDVTKGIRPEDMLFYDNVYYRVIGRRVYKDWSGRTAYVKVLCEEQSS